jgi:hypothetical protein
MNGTLQASSQTRWRDVAILALLVIAMAVPFLGQPFHMDDTIYLDLARNALHKPLYPNDLPYVFEGTWIADMGSHSHPPFQTYFLAAILWMFGEGAGKEWIYHSISLIFPLLAVISFYFLCSRFLNRPLWAASLFACCPVFLVMAHNLMTDIPNLSFWLASVATFLHANEKNNTRAYAASSLFQFCAMLTSYPSLALTPLLAFYHYRRGRSAKGWISLLAPVILMIIWFTFTSLHYGRFLFARTLNYMHGHDPWSLWKLAVKFGAILEYQGWLTVFPIFLLAIIVCSLRRPLLLAAAIFSLSATWFASPRYPLFDRIIYALGVLIGIAILYRIATIPFCGRDKVLFDLRWRDTEKQFLCFWYFGVIAYCMALYLDGSARYILPLIPPVILCFCRMLEVRGMAHYCRFISGKGQSAARYAAIAFTGLWGLALSHADLEFASIYPRAAREFAAIAGQSESYYGGEWGFRYYFGRAGFRQLTPDNQHLPVGSLLARPSLALPYELSKAAVAASKPLLQRTYKLKNPLRLLDNQSTAGFYSTYWGKLPFSLSWESQETIEIRLFQSSVDRSSPVLAPGKMLEHP